MKTFLKKVKEWWNRDHQKEAVDHIFNQILDNRRLSVQPPFDPGKYRHEKTYQQIAWILENPSRVILVPDQKRKDGVVSYAKKQFKVNIRHQIKVAGVEGVGSEGTS